MKCLLCGHSRAHKHGKTKKRIQRYKCPHCERTFPENLNSLYYNRHLSPEEVHTILQSHAKGSSLRGVSRISGRAYGTVVSLIRDASQKAQMVHNAEVQQVKTDEVIGDEMWSFIKKRTAIRLRKPQRKDGASKQKNCQQEDVERGDGWIGISKRAKQWFNFSCKGGKAYRSIFV